MLEAWRTRIHNWKIKKAFRTNKTYQNFQAYLNLLEDKKKQYSISEWYMKLVYKTMKRLKAYRDKKHAFYHKMNSAQRQYADNLKAKTIFALRTHAIHSKKMRTDKILM